MLLQPSRSPQAHIYFYCQRDPKATESQRSLEDSPANRETPGSQAGAVLPFGFYKGRPVKSANFKDTHVWFRFFPPAAKQKWHLGLDHLSPASGIHTPTKQGQKSRDSEAGLDRLLPTGLKTENWEKAHVGSFFKK